MGVKKIEDMSNKDDMKNIYRSNNLYTDRNAKSIEFPELDIKISKVSTVLLLLQSGEDDVMEKALYHLDKYASLGNQQLYKLTENHIFDFLLKLIRSENLIVRKFTYKLIVQLISINEDCRKKMLTDDYLMAEVKDIFMTSLDDSLIEYSCIILQFVFKDIKQADMMGRDDSFLKAIFKRFSSRDPDILFQSLLMLNLIMKNPMLRSCVINLKEFPLKNLQIELNNECQQIQLAAFESMVILTSCEHPYKIEFSTDRLINLIIGFCMLSENLEIQKLALKLFRNIIRSDEKLLVKLSQHLTKFLQKFNDIEGQDNIEEILSILTEFSALEDNRRVMCQNGIFKKIFKLIKEKSSMEACNFMSVMSTDISCFNGIFSENIYEILLDAVMGNLTICNRSTALMTFEKLINLYGLHYLEDISERIGRNFAELLNAENPVCFTTMLIAILEKLSRYSDLKMSMCETKLLANAVYSTFHSSKRYTKLIIRLFHLISNYIDQETFRISFIEHCMFDMIKCYLQSHVHQMKVTVCSLINMSSNYPELSARIVDEDILKILLENVECSVCSDGVEAILGSDLSLKFMLRRKLDVNDRITSGFYASRDMKLDFMEIRHIMNADDKCPIYSIYTVNFEEREELDCVGRKILKDKTLINLKCSLLCNECFNCSDEYEKVRILAREVANFLQTEGESISHHLQIHIKTLKFKYSTSVLPLGSLIYGHSFEAAMLFKVLADQFNLNVTLTTDKNGKSWNECDGNNIVDLIFDIGEIYEINSVAGQKYLQKIS